MSSATQTRLPVKTIVKTLQKYIVRAVIGLVLVWWALPLFVTDLLIRNAASITCTREMRFERSLHDNSSVTFAGGLDGCIEHTTFYNAGSIIMLVCSVFLTIMVIGYEVSDLSHTSDSLVSGRRFARTVDSIDETLGDYSHYIIVVGVILGLSLLIVVLASIATMAMGS